MEELNVEKARLFAENTFKQMPDLECRWYILHSECMILAIKELAKISVLSLDLNKMMALAWLHDIGKVYGENNHAEMSLKIAEKQFKLDNLDRDCILNHGSKGLPQSNEARLFQKADGLSLFYPKIIHFRFWGRARNGAEFDEVEREIKEVYEKYLKLYSGDKPVIELLKEKYKFIKS